MLIPMEKQIWLGYPTIEPHRYKFKIKFCLSLSVLMTEDAEDLKSIFINGIEFIDRQKRFILV